MGMPIISHDLTFLEDLIKSLILSHLDQEGIVGNPKSGFLRNTARVSRCWINTR
jgi:hypothetical protein